MLMAGNQLGKTLAASMETAMHLTATYPEWWVGIRFDRPVRWIAGSESTELTRKGVQRLLLGNPEDRGSWGTGAIPKAAILSHSMRQGIPDAVASILVQSKFGISSIQLQSYDQGRTKWQADTLDGAWLDEEPPEPVYTEVLTRTNMTLGPVYTTLTPLLGVSNVVGRFYGESAMPGTHLTMMSIFEAEHYSPEQRNLIIAQYQPWERDARTKGIPQLGSGKVFQVDPAEITCDPFPIPSHWPRIGGLDFGWDHPSAAVQCVWDRDSDRFFVIAEHRAREQTPLLLAGAVRPWGAWMPWAWPHDGKASGGKFDRAEQEQLHHLYRNHGLNMLGVHAQFEDGTNGVEAGIMDMLERMQTGRWQVFSTCKQWFEEFSLYHRKDGLIVKERDDLISASRYALMMKRFAKVQFESVQPNGRSFSGQPRNDGLSWMGQ